ncbi:MAG: DUF1622 domain-containing protein [Cellulosilyticaceae bacterium]
MLEHLIVEYLPIIIHILEFMGIIIITIGAFQAFYQYLLGFFNKTPSSFKYHFANSMATGLEFKLAAEILKTVLVRSLNEIVILGSIIILRMLITLVIHWEIKEEHELNNKR